MKFNAIRNAFLMLVLTLPVLFSSSRADAYAFLDACAPTWENLPVRYKINDQGSRNFSNISAVESIMAASFDAWAQPCCSKFSSQYDGLTSLTADRNQGQVILSFAEDRFPPEYGGRDTIAVTLLSISRSCRILQAPILFNGYNFQFRNDGRDVDLQSVATHEVGHLIGLDHSHIGRATMYYAYSGGTSARKLHDDDIQGACALYPRVCSCDVDSECPGDEQCIGGQCEKVPCTDDDQCADELVCLNGDCVVPPCYSNAECGPGFQCTSEKCVSICPTCRSCEQQGECGGNGHCVNYGAGDSKCLVLCTQGGLCPGDSECFEIPQENQTIYGCLNPNANVPGVGLCPDSYTCKDKPKETNPDPGTPDPGKPDPGKPDPGTPDPGNNADDDPDDDLLVIVEDSGRRSDCSVVSVNDVSSTGGILAILLVGGLFARRRHRHRRND